MFNNLLITFYTTNYVDFIRKCRTKLKIYGRHAANNSKPSYLMIFMIVGLLSFSRLTIQENNLQLAVANDFYKDWLEENYLPLIEKALILTGHEELTATLTVDIQSFDTQYPAKKPR